MKNPNEKSHEKSYENPMKIMKNPVKIIWKILWKSFGKSFENPTKNPMINHMKNPTKNPMENPMKIPMKNPAKKTHENHMKNHLKIGFRTVRTTKCSYHKKCKIIKKRNLRYPGRPILVGMTFLGKCSYPLPWLTVPIPINIFRFFPKVFRLRVSKQSDARRGDTTGFSDPQKWF